MTTLDSFVREVEQAIASGDSERRTRSLGQLTSLFIGQASNLNEAHVSVFDEVILRLARDVEQRARAELSARLSGIENAPKKIVKDLAHDNNVAVAQPVLERSSQLNEDDLLEVADQKAQDHLLAISRRSALSERITDVLVDRGDPRVIRALAENGGAKLSDRGLTKLVERAHRDGDLKGLLEKRPDVSGDRLSALANAAQKEAGLNEAVLKPRPEAALEIQRMEAALAKLAASAWGGSQPAGRDFADILVKIARTAKGKPIEEVRVTSWVKGDRIDDALAAIAHNGGLSASAVAKAYETDAFETLLLVVRAARLSWNTFKLLLTSKNGKAPSAEILKGSFETFQHLPVSNAQQLARLIGRQDIVRSSNAT